MNASLSSHYCYNNTTPSTRERRTSIADFDKELAQVSHGSLYLQLNCDYSDKGKVDVPSLTVAEGFVKDKTEVHYSGSKSYSTLVQHTYREEFKV